MWCLRRMEKISWTDHVRNEEVLLSVQVETILSRTTRAGDKIEKNEMGWACGAYGRGEGGV